MGVYTDNGKENGNYQFGFGVLGFEPKAVTQSASRRLKQRLQDEAES